MRCRRTKPSTVAGRKRVAELSKIISNTRTSKADRERALAELDWLAPFIGKGTPAKSQAPAAEASEEKEGSLEPSLSTEQPAKEKESTVSDLLEECYATIPGLAELRAKYPEADFGVCFRYLNPGCREMDAAHYIARDWPGLRNLPEAERHEALVWHNTFENGHLPGREREALFAEVCRRFEEDPDWFEQAVFQSPKPLTSLPKPEAPTPAPPPPVKESESHETSTKQHPVADAAIDLRQRAELILASDGWLTRLGEHNDGAMKAKILAALVQQLFAVGFADGIFCARLYNTLRPRGLSQFPERKF